MLPVVKLASDAQVAASGQWDQPIRAKGEDEVADLENSLNQILGRIRTDLAEIARISGRIEELEIMDETTGVYNLKYMKSRLAEEIQRAIQFSRPCALAVFDPEQFDLYQQKVGVVEAEMTLKQIGALLKSQVEEVDRVGRVAPHLLGVILPERNKREAIELAGEIRNHLESQTKFKFRVVVSENPLDGGTAEELFEKALQKPGG